MVSFSASRSQNVGPPDVNWCWLHWLGQQEETMRRAGILALLYLLPAIWILQPVIDDPDIWWHLQAGKWIMEHGALPSTDPFSSYGEGKSWVAYSWLFEVGMYELVRVFGEGGVIGYSLVSLWLSMLVIHRIVGTRTHHFVFATGLMVAAVIAMAPLFTPRPWLLTILFFAITLEVVLLLREGKNSRWFWALPLVYVVWANVHIQFIYGLGLLGLACVAPLIDRRIAAVGFGQEVMAWDASSRKRLVALAFLCWIATLANPQHVQLYATVVELSTQTGMWEYTQELQSPAFRTVPDWAMLLLFGLALIRLGRQRLWSSFEIIFLLVGAVCAFRGARDVWFLVMATLVVFMTGKTSDDYIADRLVSRPVRLTALVFTIVGVISIIGYQEFSQERILANTAKLYPTEAASAVETASLSGPLYNHFDWGGYLIWRLPHLKVSMDGRANVHGDERIKRALATWAGSSGWKDDPELNEAGVVIAKSNMALASLLRLDPRFRVAYEDQVAVVFSRSKQATGHSSSPAFPVSLSSMAHTAVARTR